MGVFRGLGGRAHGPLHELAKKGTKVFIAKNHCNHHKIKFNYFSAVSTNYKVFFLLVISTTFI